MWYMENNTNDTPRRTRVIYIFKSELDCCQIIDMYHLHTLKHMSYVYP